MCVYVHAHTLVKGCHWSLLGDTLNQCVQARSLSPFSAVSTTEIKTRDVCVYVHVVATHTPTRHLLVSKRQQQCIFFSLVQPETRNTLQYSV